jgi:microcystin-dependent protein
MVTLRTGDIWSDVYANASLKPILDGFPEIPGHGDKVIDSWLSDASGQIKQRVSGYLDRMVLSVASGLSVNYSGCLLRSASAILTIAPGTAFISNVSGNYAVFISKNNLVEVAVTFPTECVPLAIVTVAAGAITALADARHQGLEEIRPIGIPAQQAFFQAGDVKGTFRSTVDPGWALCNGASLAVASYTALFAAIGYNFGGSGGNFNIPNFIDRMAIGSGNLYSAGSIGGTATKTLTISEMPYHNHPFIDTPHSHSAYEQPHSHSVNDAGHDHGVRDPKHNHYSILYKGAQLFKEATSPGNGAELSIYGTGTFLGVEPSATGINVLAGSSNLSLGTSQPNVTVNPATTGSTIANQGGNGAFSLLPPYIGVNYWIKTI